MFAERGQLLRSYAGDMATDVGAARIKVTGDVRSFARNTERDLNKALAGMDLDPVEVRANAEKAVKDVGHDLANVDRIGSQAGINTGNAFSEELHKNTNTKKTESKLKASFTSVGKMLVKTLASSLSAGLSTLPSLAMPALVVAGLGIAAGIAAVVGPALGGLIASAVLAAGGLGVIGLGAFLLREEPGLRDAASQLSDTVKSVFTKAAKPMLEPMIESLKVLETSFKNIGPVVRSSFGILAPAIKPVAEGLAGLVENVMPGFLSLMSAANPFLRGMAAVLPDLGADISAFLGAIADSGPEATIFFQDFIHFLGATIANLGQFIGWLTKSYVSVREFLGSLKDASDQGFFESMISVIQNLVTKGFQFLANNIGNIIGVISDMRSAVFDAVIKMISGIATALPTIIPELVAGLVSMVTTMVSTLVTLIPSLVTAAGLLVNGLVDGIITALPSLITGAASIVTSLISGLVTLIPSVIQAGLRLIQGLVEGIVSAIPTIQMAMVNLLPVLANAVLTLLPSLFSLGTQILVAIVQGIGNTLPAAVETFKTQVIPALTNMLKSEGPKFMEQGGEVIRQILQGMVDSASLILDIITTQIIPAITSLLGDNPEFIQSGVKILTDLLMGMIEGIPPLVEFITGTLIPQITAMIEANLPIIIDAGIDIMTALMNGLIEALPQIIAVIVTRIIPAMWSALIQAVPKIHQAGLQIALSLASALISSGVERAKNAMESVKNAILGFFSGAAGWLSSAGRQIIDGLVSGIRSGFERVRSTLSELTGMLPDWKGPAEVDRRILRESGQLVMEGFRLGIADQRAAIERELRSVTGDLPGFAAGRTRGGDGASAFTINFEPGSIVINGQGAQAGNDAADAILERLGQARGLM